MHLRLMRAAPAFNPVFSNIWCGWVLRSLPDIVFRYREQLMIAPKLCSHNATHE
jgi:hypothetical protein